MQTSEAGSPCCEISSVPFRPPPGLEQIQGVCPAPPPGLEMQIPSPPPGLEHMPAGFAKSMMPSKRDKGDSKPCEITEYKALLQNLPKHMLSQEKLRAMVKEARLKDVKKVSFKSDGRALVTLKSRLALQICLCHFHGMPWFQAPGSAVPRITATEVEVRKSKALPLSADAPAFVPGLSGWKAQITSDDFQVVPQAGKISHTRQSSLSLASTDGGSSDKVSCVSDSELEAEDICA